MSQPLLSILIPTVVERKDLFDKLFAKLYKMAQHEFHETGTIIQIAWECDNKEMTIGEKRNILYAKGDGIYSVQIDDDDDIPDNFISLILNNATIGADCITYQEHCIIDGGFFSSNHSLEYGDWEGSGDHILSDGFHYHRTPFFKDVIKTEIARSVPIPHIRWAEDHQWAQELKAHLKTEIHIPEYLYYYIHNSSNPVERYGLNR